MPFPPTHYINILIAKEIFQNTSEVYFRQYAPFNLALLRDAFNKFLSIL